MPSPFAKNSGEGQANSPVPLREDEIAITNSELTCDACFEITSDGVYDKKEKVLYWKCSGCGIDNVVKGIQL